MAWDEIRLELLDDGNLAAARCIDRSDVSEAWVDTADTLMELTRYGLEHGCIGHTWVVKLQEQAIGLILLGEAIPRETDPPEMRYTPFYRLMGFVIDRRWRGQGIGSAVLEKAIAAVYAEYGVRPIALGVHRENASAARFYERHGFCRTQFTEGHDVYFLRYPPDWVRHEYSFGAAVYTQTSDGLRWLVVQERGGHTGLPKGHIEPGETEEDCALREIYEETGVRAEIEPGFQETISYSVGVRREKHVTFFIAQYANQTPSPLPGEASAAMALPLDGALSAVTHEETRALLKKANEYLQQKNA